MATSTEKILWNRTRKGLYHRGGLAPKMLVPTRTLELPHSMAEGTQENGSRRKKPREELAEMGTSDRIMLQVRVWNTAVM